MRVMVLNLNLFHPRTRTQVFWYIWNDLAASLRMLLSICGLYRLWTIAWNWISFSCLSSVFAWAISQRQRLFPDVARHPQPVEWKSPIISSWWERDHQNVVIWIREKEDGGPFNLLREGFSFQSSPLILWNFGRLDKEEWRGSEEDHFFLLIQLSNLIHFCLQWRDFIAVYHVIFLSTSFLGRGEILKRVY